MSHPYESCDLWHLPRAALLFTPRRMAYWCPLNLFLFPLFFVSLDLDGIFVYHSQHSSLSHVCFDYEWRVKPSKRWCSWFQNEETKDAYSWICQNRPLCQNLQNGSPRQNHVHILLHISPSWLNLLVSRIAALKIPLCCRSSYVFVHFQAKSFP